MQTPIIIIGTGFAGYQLAREVRKLDPAIPLTLITADAGHAYAKPQLSTAFTRNKTAETLADASAEQMAAELNASLLTHTRVTEINPADKTVTAGGKILPYTALVLACGAKTLPPPLEGNAVSDVLSINHLADYADFRELISGKKQVVILGAGLIGCEFANDLANAGFSVEVISPATSPLDLLIPEKIGRFLQAALEQHGVQFHFNCIAQTVDRTGDSDDKKFMLTLSNGKQLVADLVLSATGLRAHTALAKKAGIATSRGITVNRYLETSVQDIYALGDCAEVEGHLLPYIAPIRQAARALAATLTGSRTAAQYPAMPVSVKTPAHPVVICLPAKNASGTWQIAESDNGIRALFTDEHGKVRGFILTGKNITERATLIQEIPGFF